MNKETNLSIGKSLSLVCSALLVASCFTIGGRPFNEGISLIRNNHCDDGISKLQMVYADKGSPDRYRAAFYLGSLWQDGRCVKQDYEIAEMWYDRSGEPAGQNRIAMMKGTYAQAADGGGHGAAYGCVQRGSRYVGGPDFPYKVTLTNTCEKAVTVWWCARNPNTTAPGWRCLSDSRPANSVYVGFDTLGVFCRDASCGDWDVEWNAIYADSGENLTSPEEKDKSVTGGR
jgi:hypothetical protein